MILGGITLGFWETTVLSAGTSKLRTAPAPILTPFETVMLPITTQFAPT
jgi:hypothetical protein